MLKRGVFFGQKRRGQKDVSRALHPDSLSSPSRPGAIASYIFLARAAHDFVAPTLIE